jgi:hypothetical protein
MPQFVAPAPLNASSPADRPTSAVVNLNGDVVTWDGWRQEDLSRRLCLALNIAKRVIAVLGESGYWAEDSPDDSFSRDKPLAETAMLLYVASAVTGQAEVKQCVADLTGLLEPYARSGRTACAIALHPTICFQLAMPHILLSRLGSRDSAFDRLIGLSAHSLAHRGREVIPHRALERMWLESLWKGEPPGPEFDTAAAASVLNNPIDLFWGSREDAYAHTHTFMYFTDFGFTPRPLPRSRAKILGESSALLARSLVLEDYDLAAEVLMAWPLTNAPWNAASAFGFRVLAELEDRVGYLPAGNGIPEKFDRLKGDERTKYALAASYHTAFVMGMLCGLALKPNNIPPDEIAGDQATPVGFVDEVLGMIPLADTPWRDSLHRLNATQQATLAPFLLDVALFSSGRRHDFAVVARLLNLASRQECSATPLCAQAADLLLRICQAHQFGNAKTSRRL